MDLHTETSSAGLSGAVFTEKRRIEASRALKNLTEGTIREYCLIAPGDRILAAVSGGPDSMALLVILKTLSEEMGFDLGVAHVNHCLRGDESDRDAAFVEEYVNNLGLDFHMAKIDANAYRREHGLSPEEAARDVRFGFLYSAMEKAGYTKIATAHHSGDNSELVLMNLIRGTGPDGLEGMRPFAPEKRVIRPFFRASRRDINMFLDNTNTPFRLDSSNEDENLLRNAVRKRLIPHIENRFNGKIRDALNRLSDIMAAENDFMNREVDARFPEIVLSADPDEICLNPENLANLHPAISKRVIRRAINSIKGDLKRITQAHIDGVLDLAVKDYQCELHFPGRIRAIRRNGAVILRRENFCLRHKEVAADYMYTIYDLDFLPHELIIPQAGVRVLFRRAEKDELSTHKGADKVFFEKKGIHLPVTIRNIRQGDRFQPIGMKGSKTVLRFLMDLKVSEPQRRLLPVMESDGEILWIPGFRISEKMRIKNPENDHIVAEIMR